MFYVFDAIYLLISLLCSPVLLYGRWKRGKYREGWKPKLTGRVPERLDSRPCIWFHAVSVGEVLLLRPLVADLAQRRPDCVIVISTTTATGLSVARQTFPDLVTFYAPLDFSWAVRRAITRIRPTVLALVETELWPNLVRFAKASGARVAVINGRLSEGSHRGYRKIARLLAPTLRRLDAIGAQSEASADRFIDLGVSRAAVRTTGSVKYDGLESDRAATIVHDLRRITELDGSAPVFVAGSTMAGEEIEAWKAYRAVAEDHPDLRLVLVPRHPERGTEVARWLEAQGELVWRRSLNPGSHGRAPSPESTGPKPILLFDTVGELSGLWGLADFAFVGGSLFRGRGGQNMMEPAAFGSLVIFGPHTQHFKEAVEGLLGRDAAIRVEDGRGLEKALRSAFADPRGAERRGRDAQRFVAEQRGATSRTIALLEELIGPRRVAPRARSARSLVSSAA